MKKVTQPSQSREEAPYSSESLFAALAKTMVGQSAALHSIVPYVHMYKAGLAPEGRPVGVFLLLGPTGTGKTKTVEALAGVLHGSEKSLVRIDCGEFQLEHEVAKLIGAPPGYLGHRETQPMITQQALTAATSDACKLSIVLFDEIEKAAPSLNRLLLGVLDRAVLRLGDNSAVNFENSLIFLTSNLGAREMFREIQPGFGFRMAVPGPSSGLARKLERVGMEAVRRRFSPEFVNRIDAVITYEPLGEDSLATILDRHIEELQQHVHARLGPRGFHIDVPEESRRFLLEEGASSEYGARELKRTVHRHLTQPLAAMVSDGEIEPGSRVRVVLREDAQSLLLCPEGHVEAETAAGSASIEAAKEPDPSTARRRTARSGARQSATEGSGANVVADG